MRLSGCSNVCYGPSPTGIFGGMFRSTPSQSSSRNRTLETDTPPQELAHKAHSSLCQIDTRIAASDRILVDGKRVFSDGFYSFATYFTTSKTMFFANALLLRRDHDMAGLCPSNVTKTYFRLCSVRETFPFGPDFDTVMANVSFTFYHQGFYT